MSECDHGGYLQVRGNLAHCPACGDEYLRLDREAIRREAFEEAAQHLEGRAEDIKWVSGHEARELRTNAAAIRALASAKACKHSMFDSCDHCESPSAKRKCAECDGKGRWFDASHGCSRHCKDCDGTGSAKGNGDE